MKTKLCDMHVHSYCSDGTCSPKEVAVLARQAGLSAVALCDHNTFAGLPLFLESAKEQGIIGVPGIEITCGFKGKEVHVLGLFLKEESYSEITAFLAETNRLKEQSNLHMLESLNAEGFGITYERVVEIAEGGLPNRVHFARALMEIGAVSSVDSAFEGLLSKGGKHYRPCGVLQAFATVEFLKSIKALPVLAHPFLNLSNGALREFLPEAKRLGLAGMECMYSEFGKRETEKAFALAEEFGLVPAGGSDFHGANKPDIKIGFGRDNLQIPFSIYESLKSAHEEMQ